MTTKLEKMLEEADRGLSSATGLLTKMLRGVWRDLGLNNAHIDMLITQWLDDPDNQYQQDQTKLHNAKGNIRKDLEKDDTTWKIFVRNLRILRPAEVRFVVNIRFRNGRKFKQVAVMRPPQSKKYGSDFIFEENPDQYDEDGNHSSEPEYTAPNGLKINQIEFEKDEIK